MSIPKIITVNHCLTYHFKVKSDFDIDNDNAITALLSNGTPEKVVDNKPVVVRDDDKVRDFNYEG